MNDENRNRVKFTGCKYNHGNKGPSKKGFDLSLSTNSEDWFKYSGSLVCKGFKIEGVLFGETFTFEIEDDSTYKITFEKEECTIQNQKTQQPIRNTFKTVTYDNPQLLLKNVYPHKTLSANAMLVFGCPAIQKIGSVISGKSMDPEKSENYEDEYYSDARESIKTFLDDFQNKEVKEEYVITNDWSWDKKTNQKRGRNKVSKKKTNSTAAGITNDTSTSTTTGTKQCLENTYVQHQAFLKKLSEQYETLVDASNLVPEKEQIVVLPSPSLQETKRLRESEQNVEAIEIPEPVLKKPKPQPSQSLQVPLQLQTPPEVKPQTKKKFKFDISNIDISKYTKFKGSEFEATDLTPPKDDDENENRV